MTTERGGQGVRTERWAGIALMAAWCVPVGLTYASSPAPQGGGFAGNIASLLFAPLLVLLAAGAGDWVLDRVLRIRGEFAGRTIFAVGLGLAAFAFVTLGAGSTGIPAAEYAAFGAWVVCITLTFLLGPRIWRIVAGLARRTAGNAKSGEDGREWPVLRAVMVLVMAVLVGLNVLRAFVPPMEYDEMEYHLGAPAKYYRDGRITFIADNAYANFPNNVEMLFLDGMVLRGGVYEGLALSRLMNVAFGLLAACAAGACAGAMFGRRAALPAAAILYTWPSVNQVTHVAYVELGLMMWTGLALLSAYEYVRTGRDVKWLVLLAVSCGLAVGCKYPAALFVCVPACVCVVLAGRAGWKKIAMHTAAWGGMTLAALSPWLVRNAVNTGNPVYPLGWTVFDGRTWSDRKDARWQRAHSPKDMSLAASWKALKDAALSREPSAESPYSMSLLLVVFAPLAFVRREWRWQCAVLLGLTLFAVVAWLMFTHRIVRFLVPWLVPLVALNAAGAVALFRWRIAAVASGVALCVLLGAEAWATVQVRAPVGEMQMLAGSMGTDQFLVAMEDENRGQLTYSHKAVMSLHGLPWWSRVLFYGEAAALYCRAGHFECSVIAPTVFDENPLDAIVARAKSAEEAAAELRAMKVTHIYVNLAELHRLQWSYAFKYGGRRWAGYCTLTEEAEFARMRELLMRHARVVYPAVSESAWSGAAAQYGAKMNPRPEAGEGWEEYVARSVVWTMRNADRGKPPIVAAPFVMYEVKEER